MSRFEYKNSISLNCLVKLAVLKKVNNQTEETIYFDHHEKGLNLQDIINDLNLYRHKETQGKTTKIYPNEEKSMKVLYDIREDIKKAISEEKLIIDDFDTKDCNEYRICYKGALKWCDNYPRPQYIFDMFWSSPTGHFSKGTFKINWRLIKVS